MTDFMSKENRSLHMAKIRSKDTKPELKVRQILHAAGYRYRLHDKNLPGTPDLVFAGRHKAIFVHGCFWHGHECPVGSRLPKSNTQFWADKRAHNQTRDLAQLDRLRSLGWDVLIVWECETKDDQDLLASAKSFLDG